MAEDHAPQRGDDMDRESHDGCDICAEPPTCAITGEPASHWYVNALGERSHVALASILLHWRAHSEIVRGLRRKQLCGELHEVTR